MLISKIVNLLFVLPVNLANQRNFPSLCHCLVPLILLLSFTLICGVLPQCNLLMDINTTFTFSMTIVDICGYIHLNTKAKQSPRLIISAVTLKINSTRLLNQYSVIMELSLSRSFPLQTLLELPCDTLVLIRLHRTVEPSENINTSSKLVSRCLLKHTYR